MSNSGQPDGWKPETKSALEASLVYCRSPLPKRLPPNSKRYDKGTLPAAFLRRRHCLPSPAMSTFGSPIRDKFPFRHKGLEGACRCMLQISVSRLVEGLQWLIMVYRRLIRSNLGTYREHATFLP